MRRYRDPRPARVSDAVASASLVLTVFSLGIMAGFFGTYSGNVNFATLELDGPTYSQVQSALNRHVRHPLFFAFFFGPPLLCLVTLAAAGASANRGGGSSPPSRWATRWASSSSPAKSTSH